MSSARTQLNPPGYLNKQDCFGTALAKKRRSYPIAGLNASLKQSTSPARKKRFSRSPSLYAKTELESPSHVQENELKRLAQKIEAKQ